MTRGLKIHAAMLAAVAMASAGCAEAGVGEPAAAASAAPSASASSAPAFPTDPRRAVADAFAALEHGRYRYRLRVPGAGITVTADANTGFSHGVMVAAVGGREMRFQIMNRAPEMFLKIDLTEFRGEPGTEGLDGGTWLRIDPDRIDDLSFVPGELMPLERSVLDNILAVENMGMYRFKGTIDMTRMNRPQPVKLPDEQLEGLKAASFTVETDSQGRLTLFWLEPEIAGHVRRSKFDVSEYGTATLPPAPGPGEYIDAPENVYTLFARK